MHPRKKLAYVAMVNEKDNAATTQWVWWTSIPHPPATATSSATWTCRTPETSCIISAGMHAAPACARTLRILTWSAATGVPGIHSSRIHILDTKPDPRNPQIVKVIEPETLAARTGYASPHTVHCGPDGS